MLLPRPPAPFRRLAAIRRCFSPPLIFFDDTIHFATPLLRFAFSRVIAALLRCRHATPHAADAAYAATYARHTPMPRRHIISQCHFDADATRHALVTTR